MTTNANRMNWKRNTKWIIGTEVAFDFKWLAYSCALYTVYSKQCADCAQKHEWVVCFYLIHLFIICQCWQLQATNEKAVLLDREVRCRRGNEIPKWNLQFDKFNVIADIIVYCVCDIFNWKFCINGNDLSLALSMSLSHFYSFEIVVLWHWCATLLNFFFIFFLFSCIHFMWCIVCVHWQCLFILRNVIYLPKCLSLSRSPVPRFLSNEICVLLCCCMKTIVFDRKKKWNITYQIERILIKATTKNEWKRLKQWRVEWWIADKYELSDKRKKKSWNKFRKQSTSIQKKKIVRRYCYATRDSLDQSNFIAFWASNAL